MTYCPSHDWDRYCNEQDAAMEAAFAFYQAYAGDILQVVCALIARGAEIDKKRLVDTASDIVMEIIQRQGVEQ